MCVLLPSQMTCCSDIHLYWYVLAVYLWQIHIWDAAVPIEDTLRTLNDLVWSGKVRHIGVSNVCGWQLQKIASTCQHMGLEPVISLQVQNTHYTIQYNTIQYNTIQYNTSTIQYNTIRYNTIQYNTFVLYVALLYTYALLHTNINIYIYIKYIKTYTKTFK
jgi:diketogulonate reductase-like aldo/keto reductase